MIRIKRAGVSVHVSIDSNLIALSSENCFYVDVSKPLNNSLNNGAVGTYWHSN